MIFYVLFIFNVSKLAKKRLKIISFEFIWLANYGKRILSVRAKANVVHTNIKNK